MRVSRLPLFTSNTHIGIGRHFAVGIFETSGRPDSTRWRYFGAAETRYFRHSRIKKKRMLFLCWKCKCVDSNVTANAVYGWTTDELITSRIWILVTLACLASRNNCRNRVYGKTGNRTQSKSMAEIPVSMFVRTPHTNVLIQANLMNMHFWPEHLAKSESEMDATALNSLNINWHLNSIWFLVMLTNLTMEIHTQRYGDRSHQRKKKSKVIFDANASRHDVSYDIEDATKICAELVPVFRI